MNTVGNKEQPALATEPPPLQPASGTAGTAMPSARICPSCGTAANGGGSGVSGSPAYVYAIGKIEPRFPRLSVEKEFAQVIGRADAKGLTDRQALQAILSKAENRYLVRQLCWVMTIEGLETYILLPRVPDDFGLLVESLRPNPTPADLDVVIGVRGPLAPAEVCNGLVAPFVFFDQIYTFDRPSLMRALPKPEKMKAEEFAPAAQELFDRILQLTASGGETDEQRALNYLAVRHPGIYTAVAEAFARNASLSAVDVRPSLLSGTRKVVEVIFSFTNRATDVVDKSFVRVDVLEEFPFLVSKLSPYYDR
jgi:hypothetical protein